jgi:hypothetical protein
MDHPRGRAINPADPALAIASAAPHLPDPALDPEHRTRTPNVTRSTPRGAPDRHQRVRDGRRTERRLCARFDCRLTRRSVPLYVEHERPERAICR